MWKFISCQEFQRDVSVGWLEFCDAKIKYWNRMCLLSCKEHSRLHCVRMVKHFKSLKRW